MQKSQGPRLRRWPTQMAVGSLVFLLAFHDVCVLGFLVKWCPFAVRSTKIRRESSNLKDPMENFPNTLNMPMPLGNMTAAANSRESSNFVRKERLDRLLETIDIVSVVEAYGLPRFSRSGQFRATCLCPFHDDRNPSMSIDSSRGIYKCFSCGAGGNALSFVREYSKIQGVEMSFSEAVKLLERRCASGDFVPLPEPSLRNSIRQNSLGIRTFYNATSTLTGSAKAPIRFQTSSTRILMANAVAAAFYEECLGRGYAGLARSHLRERGMQPRTIRSFALGYAPDAYFNVQGARGEGSLVEHLQRKGFTSTEILDAGLATILKKDVTKIEIQQEKDKKFQIPYSSLMDRFRGRLMVPIFDASGLQVLGFGGRVLDGGFTSESENFAGPKYLNSPESPVFQKKNILFGQHMATKALRFWDKEEHIARAVVIVEGYMDAIALWQYGVREAVACMGTGLTEEQITAAAVLAGDKNGRVVICLDNDDAGIAAVERVCRSGILATVSASKPVEFRVGLLPAKVKDPADYMILHKEDSKPDETFRLEVLEQNSIHWMDWYQHRTISQYNSTAQAGEKWSFSDVMNRLGALLSMIRESSDRKRRFDQIIGILLKILAKDDDTYGVSEAVRLQIQTELERQVSIMSGTKKLVSLGALAKIESTGDKLSKTLARMAPFGSDFRSDILPRERKHRKDELRRRMEAGRMDVSVRSQSNQDAEVPPGRRFRPKASSKHKPSLTPHFSGFRFKNGHDAAWLANEELIGKRERNSKPSKDNGNVVFFNSNEYHGDRFLTDEARSAGYMNSLVPRDPDLLTKGINSMVELSTDQLLLSAEKDLLRILLYFPSARLSLHRIISIGHSVGSQNSISWSSPENAWLFDRLTMENDILTAFDRTNIEDFQLFLASETKHIDGTFSNLTALLDGSDKGLEVSQGPPVEASGLSHAFLFPTSLQDTPNYTSTERDKNTLEERRGALDYLIVDSSMEGNPLVASMEKVALRAQECYYTVVWAGAVEILNQKHRKWEFVASKCCVDPIPDDKSNELENAHSSMPKTDPSVIFPQHDSEALRVEIQEASEQVRLLSGVLRSLSSRLVQNAMPQSLSETWNQDYFNLSSRLDKHMEQLDQWVFDDDERNHIRDSEAYETILEQAQELWGDLYDNEHFWSPADVVEAKPAAVSGHDIMVVPCDGEEVSVLDFSNRLDEEWGWLDKPPPEVASKEKPGLYEFNEKAWDQFLFNGVHDTRETTIEDAGVVEDAIRSNV